MKRRGLVFAGAAAVAAAAGVGTALWRQPRASPPDDPPLDLWSLSFDAPSGAPLRMASLRGRPLLLNFWATWCVPCVTEMPLLDAFAKRSDLGTWQVLALAVDTGEAVRGFIAMRRLALPVALAGNVGLDLSRSLGNNIGALPFTVVLGADGRVLQTKLGAVDQPLLDRWLTETGTT